MVNIFATVGISLPRTTVPQLAFATPVTADEAMPGDLVFFDNTCSNCGANPTHVGLVIGPGKMIDAGDPVHIEPIYSGHNARFGRVFR
jgi:cell wall-associated NlpC family hydrolase